MSCKTKAQIATEYGEKQTAIKALMDLGDNMTPDQLVQAETLIGERDALKGDLDKFASMASVKAQVDAGEAFLKTPVLGVPKPQASSVKADRIDNGEESEDDKYIRKGPFKGLGHFAYEVRHASNSNVLSGMYNQGALGEWNTRIRKVSNAIKAMPEDVKAVTGMSELIDTDGAAFVPVDIAQSIWERSIKDEENLLNLVDLTPVSGNGYTVHAWNDKSRTSGSLYGGARAYWGSEGSQGTNVKPGTRDINFRLNKLTVLMPVTEELLEDAVALDVKLQRVASACFAYEVNKAIVRGDGVGKPQGILTSAASTAGGPRLVNAAVASQGANTIVGANVTSMYSKRPPGSESRLVWLYNTDIEPQLDQLNFTAGSTAAQWMYLQAGGLRESMEPRLKGRRMIATEHCSALGTEGDLILWDPASYGAIVKTSGIKQAVSMHLRFDYGEAVFRWAFRFDGRPLWDDVLTPANGGTRSSIITLNSTRT
jgi:HK97 family phage major capsid protein